MQLLTILALAIALLAVLFALQNPTPVLINFFVWQFQDPLAVVILITLVVGVAAGVLVSFPTILRHSWKLGTYRKRLEDLGRQLQQKEQEVAAMQQHGETLRQKHQEMLTAIGVTEPRTGLLRGESALSGVTYLLQQQAASPTGSVCVYVLAAEAATLQDAVLTEQVWRAIAQQLQQTVPPGTWLHHDGGGHFTCVVTGVDTRSAGSLGEKLKAALTDQPLPLEGGVSLPLTVSIGGAIAPPTEHLDSHSLLQQAETARQHAHKRGRNRFRLVEATAASPNHTPGS